MSRHLLRHEDGLLPHGLALSYGVLGFAGGLALMMAPSAAANGAGVLLLAHALVICAYLIHECAHNTIFAATAWNARLAVLLGWITGSCYAPYGDLRRKHFRHHVERADVVGFDYRWRIRRHPRLVRLIAALEWAYIPAVELLLHALTIALPFVDPYYRPLRQRVFVILACRTAQFAVLGLLSPKVLLLYVPAYLLFLTVLRFMDANQHTYELVETHDDPPLPGAERRDHAYEYRNTYSNLLSVRHPVLNLLILNFAYHNAHHERPTVPWYRLPALHRALYGYDTGQVLPLSELLGNYHRYRVARAFHPGASAPGAHAGRGPDPVGIDGVSFLVPV